MRSLFKVILVLLMVATAYACSGSQATPDTTNALFFDDFSQSSSGWTQVQNENGTSAYDNGSFHISINKASTLLLANPGKSFGGDVSIEVDARKIGGSDDNYFGVLCHYQDPDDYYMFLITSDGYAGIIMRKGGEETLISPGKKFLKMDGINNGGTTNHIRADCVGEALTLYANGQQVSLAYNSSLTGGDVGLAVRSGNLEGGTDIRFDNFVVNSASQP
jgi:hypothetical protein